MSNMLNLGSLLAPLYLNSFNKPSKHLKVSVGKIDNQEVSP